MHCFVVSIDQELGAKVQEFLLREGHECESSSLDQIDHNPDFLGGATPDIVLVAASSNHQKSLAFLRQARGSFQGRVFTVGLADDPKQILQTLREGADQYLDEADLEAELARALARTKVQGANESGYIITVLAASGGSGSSTLVINMATLLAQQAKSSVVFDLKPGLGDLAPLLDVKPTHTLADLCLNPTAIDRVVFERSLTRHRSGVHLLAPPLTLAEIARVTPKGVRQALSIARSLYPFVVVDLDDCFHEEQAQALRMADLVLLVFRLDFTSLRNMRRTMDHLDQLGIHRERVRLVVNRYGQAKELPSAKAEEVLGLKIFHYIPEDAKTVNLANNNGIPAVLDSPKASVSKSIAKLTTGVQSLVAAH